MGFADLIVSALLVGTIVSVMERVCPYLCLIAGSIMAATVSDVLIASSYTMGYATPSGSVPSIAITLGARNAWPITY